MRKFLLGLVAMLVINPAFAASPELGRFFGHSVSVDGDYPEMSLKIDGRELHRNAILAFEDVAVVAGVPVLIGKSSNGGNACDGTPFVVSFPPSGDPRIDGPLEICSAINYKIGASEIAFSTNNVPGKGREHWVWKPDSGITKLADEEFRPTANTGWDALLERSIEHPADIFQNAEIGDDVSRLLGPRLSEFQGIIVGTGSGRFLGDDFVGSACSRHMCGEQEAMVFLDARTRTAYVAWKPFDEKIVVYPPVKGWPEKARLELKQWAGKWK
ncbi:MAG: hypothetical protein KL863_00295 [Rhizobium sp.]|nr:hypothetical protein [Rhizobium sp.]